MVDVRFRGVVTEQHHLDAPETHDPVGLRPAAVVADAHSQNPAEGPPYREPEVSDLEVALFEVLKGLPGGGAPRARADGSCGNFPTIRPGTVHQDRGVETAGPAASRAISGVSEMEADSEPPRGVEEGTGLRPRHGGLEEAVNLAPVLEVVPREESGERQLRKHDQAATAGGRPLEQTQEARHHLRPGLRGLDSTKLGRGNAEDAHPDAQPPSAARGSGATAGGEGRVPRRRRAAKRVPPTPDGFWGIAISLVGTVRRARAPWAPISSSGRLHPARRQSAAEELPTGAPPGPRGGGRSRIHAGGRPRRRARRHSIIGGCAAPFFC